MGNELLSKVGNISGTASVSPAPSVNVAGYNAPVPNSLFNGALNGKDYSNDFMMPDCLKTGNITNEQRASIFGPLNTPAVPIAQTLYQPQAQQYPQSYALYTQQNPYNQTFSGQQVQQQLKPEEVSEYYEKLMAQNPNLRITEKGNLYEISHTGKKIGIFAGIGTALFGGIKKLCAGTALKSAFNLKSLAIKLPVLVVTGWAAGSLIDAFSNSSKASKADELVKNV